MNNSCNVKEEPEWTQRFAKNVLKELNIEYDDSKMYKVINVLKKYIQLY